LAKKKAPPHAEQVEGILILIRDADLPAAVDGCSALLGEAPELPEAHYLLGLLSYVMGDPGRAISFMEKAHAIDPDRKEYSEALSYVHTKAAHIAEGLYYVKLATALEPHPYYKGLLPLEFSNYFGALESIEPSRNYLNAILAYTAGDIQKTIEHCELELRLNAGDARCFKLLATCLNETGEYRRALDSLHAAVHLANDDAEVYCHMAESLLNLGRFAQAMSSLDVSERLSDTKAAAGLHSLRTSLLAHLSDAEWQTYRPRQAAFNETLHKEGEVVDKGRNLIEKRRKRRAKIKAAGGKSAKVRIGFISDVFCDTDEGHFIAPLLRNYDNKKFEVHCYQSGGTSDSVNTSLRAGVDHWRDLRGVDDISVATLIAGDSLDLLIDTCGSSPGQRLAVLAMRPAERQASWTAFPQPGGVAGIDYVFSDPVTVENDKSYCNGEQCVVIEPGLVALDAGAFGAPRGGHPFQETGVITFGGTLNLARLTPEVGEIWSRVLLTVPNSRLLLGNKRRVSPEITEAVSQMFANFAVYDRISIWDPEGDKGVMEEFYGQIDVMLDTFPISGMFEACHALACGAPVLSVKGNRRAALMGASVLRAAGRDKWAADDGDGFVAVALELAGDGKTLEAERESLKSEIADAPLFKPEDFTKAFEAAILDIVK